MKRRILSIALALFSVVLVFAMTSCFDKDPQDSHKHVFTEWEIVQLSTCQQEGEQVRTCECGYSERDTLPLKEHTEGEWIVEKEATCAEEGLKHKNCLLCNTVIIKETINRLEHDYYSWTVLESSDTCENNVYSRSCKNCNNTETRNGTYEDHDWFTGYGLFDEDVHRYMCRNCRTESNHVSSHTPDENGICTECSCPTTPTIGVQYEIHTSGTYAIVMKYIGSYDYVNIASEYKGVPVQVINNHAFSNTGISYVIMPDSITTIGESAFENCTYLWSINLSDNVTTIDDFAFFGCGINEIIIPDSVTHIGNQAFSECLPLSSVIIGKGVQSIGTFAFSHCNLNSILGGSENYCVEGNCMIEKSTNTLIAGSNNSVIPNYVITIESYAFSRRFELHNITIPDSVVTIRENAFEECAGLVSIVIGRGVKNIYDSFYTCNSLTDLYYTGSEKEWDSICIDPTFFTNNVKIHYNCFE